MAWMKRLLSVVVWALLVVLSVPLWARQTSERAPATVGDRMSDPVEANPHKWWTCKGPVDNCEGPNGKSGGCKNAKGKGGEEGLAKIDALQDCQRQLADGSGSWWCADDSQLVCSSK